MTVPDFIDIIVELVDGQVYVTTNIPNDTPFHVDVLDYDTAEKVSVEAAQEHKAEVAQGSGAVESCWQAWHEYLHERAVPLQA
jgi:hypothetical protein